MGKKRPQQRDDDQPSFAALNRMHEEVLRLRREWEAEEVRATVARAQSRRDSLPPKAKITPPRAVYLFGVLHSYEG